MQLLYGNDGTNYKTIAKSKEMTSGQEKQIIQGYLGYNFVKERDKYTSVYDEPISLSYVTTNLTGTLSEEKILLTKNARMSNYLTPSYYSHVHVLESSNKVYEEGFFDLLQYSFIKDVELTEYLEKDIDSFMQEKMAEPTVLNKSVIEKENIIAIISALFHVLESPSKKIRIVVDAEGDAYNQRVLDIIATLYEYIPYGIRKKVGFSTYSDIDTGISSRIKIQLFTKEAMSKLGNDAIDLSKAELSEILKTVPDEIIEFVREYVNKEEKERKELFGIFRTVFEDIDAEIEDYIYFCNNLKKWQTGDFEEEKEEMAMFAYKEMQKEKMTTVFRLFKAILANRFKAEKWDVHFRKCLQNLLIQQEDFDFDEQLEMYIWLGEAIDSFNFDKAMFLTWVQQRIIDRAEQENEDFELYTVLVKYYKQTSEISIGGQKFKIISQEMKDFLEDRLVRLKEEIQQHIQKEGEQIKNSLQVLEYEKLHFDVIYGMFKGITYKENREVFKNALYYGLEKLFNTTIYIPRYELYEGVKEFIADCGEILDKEQCNNLIEIIEEKGKVVRTMENYRKIVWDHKRDILNTYQKIFQAENYSNEWEIQMKDYFLIINGKQYIFNARELKDLTAGLLASDFRTKEELRSYLKRHTRLISDLLAIGAFSGEHFEMLMNNAVYRSDLQRDIMNYYLRDDVLISKKTVERILKEVDDDVIKDVNYRNLSESILGIVLREKSAGNKAKTQGYKERETEIKSQSKEEKAERKIDIKEGKITKNNNEDGIVMSVIMVLFILLLPICGTVAAVLVKKIFKLGIIFPLILSSIFMLILILSLGLLLFTRIEKKEICIGSAIGGLLSIIFVWMVWIIL